jgi:hypothetical protein
VNTNQDEREFDDRLRAAFSARPQPIIAPGLPGRAIARAAELAEIENRQRVAGPWILTRRISGLAAAVLIVALIGVGAWRLSQNKAEVSALAALGQSIDTSSSSQTDSSSASDPQQTMWIIGGFALLMIAVAVVGPILSSDGPRMRMELAQPT